MTKTLLGCIHSHVSPFAEEAKVDRNLVLIVASAITAPPFVFHCLAVMLGIGSVANVSNSSPVIDAMVSDRYSVLVEWYALSVVVVPFVVSAVAHCKVL